MPRHDPDQKTKQYILETATRLFSDKGFENVKIEDVVREVGVTRGAFYHYFKSREELISSVMIKSFENTNPFALADRQEGLTALEKLRFVLKLDLRPRLKMSDSLRREMQRMADNPVVFKNEMLSQVNVVAPYVEKLLLEGNADGSVSVRYPKQVSQIICMLTSSWLSPFTFQVPCKEFTDKILFFEQLGESLGVPFMDEEIKEILLEIGRLELPR